MQWYGRYVGGPTSDVLVNFLQVKYSDFYPYLFSLACLGLGYRVLGLIILKVRISQIRPT